VEFFIDIHAPVNNANDRDLIGADYVEQQIEANHKTPEPWRKS